MNSSAMIQHNRAWQLIPWQVNGTLTARESEQLRDHVDQCEKCRNEMALQIQFRDAIASQPTVEFAPQPSFNKLWARIDADASLPVGKPINASRLRRWLWWGLAAQWLLTAAGAWWYVQLNRADFRTVTSGPALPAGELKVVFDKAITLGEVESVLNANGLRSVAGPTPAGVFVLARDAQHANADLDGLVARLRTQQHVRFAELDSSVE